MKKSIVALCLMLALTSCSKNDDGGQSPATTTTTKKLTGIEFTNPDFGTPSGIVAATISYTGNNPTSITTNANFKVSIDYVNNKISKVSLKNNSGAVSSYYDISYGANGMISKSDYYTISGSTGLPQLAWSYRYTYTNNVLSRKDEYQLNGTTPTLIYYYLYENGSNGNILSMTEYGFDGTLFAKYVYTDDLIPNKMKDYPILQIIGPWMEGNTWDLYDAYCHLENQYLNKNCITQETRYDEKNALVYQTKYQISKNSDGNISQKSDSYGNIIKFTYQ